MQALRIMRAIWILVFSLVLAALLSESEAAPKRGGGRKDGIIADDVQEEPEEHARKRRNVIHGMKNKGLLLKRLAMDNRLASHRHARAVARAGMSQGQWMMHMRGLDNMKTSHKMARRAVTNEIRSRHNKLTGTMAKRSHTVM